MEPTQSKDVNKMSTLQQLFTSKFARLLLVLLACFLVSLQNFTTRIFTKIGLRAESNLEQYFKSYGKVFSKGDNLILTHIDLVPAVVTTIIGGMLADGVLGIRLTFFSAQAFIFSYAVLCQIGVIFKSYPALLIACALKGIAGSTTLILTTVILARWFKGDRGLTCALGALSSLTHAVAFLNVKFFIQLVNFMGVENIFWFEIALQFICFIIICGILLIDILGEKYGVITPQRLLKDMAPSPLKWQQTLKQFVLMPCRLPLQAWLASFIYIFTTCAFISFQAIAHDFFSIRYKLVRYPPSQMVFAIMPIVAVPILSILLEVLGYFSVALVIGGALYALFQTVFVFVNIHPLFIPIVFASTYSLMEAAFVPVIQFVTPDCLLGTINSIAFALFTSILTIFMPIIGMIARSRGIGRGIKGPVDPMDQLIGLKLIQTIFIIFSLLSVACSSILLIFDYRGKKILLTTAARLRMQQDDIQGVQQEAAQKDENNAVV